MKLMSKCVVIAVIACSAVLAGATAFATEAPELATQATEQPMPLAKGTLTGSVNSNAKVAGGRVGVQTKGNLDVLVVQTTIPPGGTSGWHSHAGPHYVVVKQGTLTTIQAKGCKVQTLQTGQASYDVKPAENRIVLNRGTDPVVFVATFVLPRGASPDVAQPAAAGCPSS
jgi:quercetin dioxygenase-like cupin family protein